MDKLTKKQRKLLLRLCLCAVLTLLARFLPLKGWVRLSAYLIPYALIGWDVLYDAARGIVQGQVFDEHFLMALATLGALALGEYAESVSVMLFYQLGELFQSIALGRSRRSIAALMDIRPELARVLREGVWTELDPEEVSVGEELELRPGERVPLDALVLSGESALDTAALTGESAPRSVREGDELISGCIVLSGVLRARVTKPYGESTVARILELTENASSRKSRSEAFITRFARIYTPSVCLTAAALALLPPLVSRLAGGEAAWGVWVYRALTFLVISCPCALVVSVPLGFFAALGGASREGILIKGSNYVEALAKAKLFAFDKTGTMSRGVFEVCGVYPEKLSPERLLALAAACESYSSHPIARSICAACAAPIDAEKVTDVREYSARGVSASVEGIPVAVGGERLMQELGIAVKPVPGAGTLVRVAVDGSYAGSLLLADRLKPHAAPAVNALRRLGVRRLVMLTGDSEAAAETAAEELGLRELHAGLLPGDKVRELERLLSEKGAGETLAFVGDGINDAPVLMRADVGIAMGALGSDAAIEAADVVLMDDDPLRLATALRLSRRCMRIVYENIGFAVGVKLLCLLLGALGLAGMWAAIFADVGVMVLAVLNAMRAMLTKNCREELS